MTTHRLPLSAAQHEIWIAHRIGAGAGAEAARQNCGGYVELEGPVDGDLLGEAVRRTLEETEALRVRFGTDEADRPWQTPVPVDELPGLITADFGAEPDPRRAAESWMAADLAEPVDPATAPLHTIALLHLEPGRSLFWFRYHHIVLDGYGQALFWRRLAETYTALAAGSTPGPRTFGSLAEVLAEEEAYRSGPVHAADAEHWSGLTSAWPDPVGLSGRAATDPRTAYTAAAGTARQETIGSTRLRAPRPLTGVGRFAGEQGTHWSAVVVAATAAYLRRTARQDDIVLDLPVRARTTRTALTTPAMLANVLPLRLTVTPGTTFREIVDRASGALRELLDHQRYRGEEIHRRIRRDRHDAGPAPVRVNAVTFAGRLRFGTADGTIHQLSTGPVPDLALDFFGEADGSEIRVTFDPNPGLHEPAALRAHRDRFAVFLDRLLAAPDRPVGEVALLTDGDTALMRSFGEEAVRHYDLSRPLHRLVTAQAERTPDAVAAETAEASLTYRVLVDRAGVLAGRLRDAGVRTGDIVGVYEERSLDLVVDLLAVLLAGAAYLPLDPELPSARLAFQIRDSGARTVLCRAALRPEADGLGVPLTLTDGAPDEPAGPAGSAPDDRPCGPDDTAYVIYTSGSTGRPKGVEVPHRGIVNRLLWMQEEYSLGADDVVLQKTPFTFDVSVWEFFWPLITGARLHVLAPGAHRDPRAIAETVRSRSVTTVHFVPSMLDLFLAEPTAAPLPSLRRVFSSGEALRPETVNRFLRVHRPGGRGPELYNLYGPTEASVDVTHWRCGTDGPGEPVPIGRAVANTTLHVLDPEGRPLPPGLEGELYIGGVQVAKGYLGRPELTAASFLADRSGPGRLYRTGDLAVLRPDGVVLYRGRLDHQVKVNGFRIEPGEIESVLLAHPGVEQAVVTAPDDEDGRPRLVAHLVAAVHPAPDALLTWLRDRLPAQMMPSRFVFLDALPLLPNGKLDRKALPPTDQDAVPPERPGTPAPAVGPSTPVEAVLHEVWSSVLDVTGFGVNESFFALGGDSMHAIRVRTRAESRGWTFDVADLFRGPTVRELAARTRAVTADGRPDAPTDPRRRPFGLLGEADRALLPAGLDDAYPLSAMQAGMLYHAAYAEDSSVYRVVTSVRVAARYDPDALRHAVDDMTHRHPALRCSFDLSRFSEPLQLVHSRVTVPVESGEDLRGMDEEERLRLIGAWVEAAKSTRFDLAEAPLLKFAVHLCEADSFELSVVEHHVVLDGWSDMRMLEEVVEHYAARLAGTVRRLPPVASLHRDFVAAERDALADPAARDHWTGLLRGAEPTVLAPAAPVDGPPGAAAVPVVHRYDVPVAADTAARLRTAARAAGLPLKSLLVAAHAAVLRLVGGRDEILTGVVANGRLEEPGGDDTIGVFLNTLPLRLDLGTGSLTDIARQAFAHEQAAAPHRRYPIAQILRDTGETAELSSYVNYMDFGRTPGGAADTLMTVTAGVAETNYPLAVNFLVDPGERRLRLWLDCDLAVLPEEFCSRLTGYYERALRAVAENADAPAATMDLLDPAEHARLARAHGATTAFERDATVHGLFERRAALTPEATALVHRDMELTYGDLDRRANRLAHHLRGLGIGSGDLVGVSVRRGPDLVISLLAVLKTGAAYVPMDPSFPRGRLEHMAADAGLACLVRGPGATEAIKALHTVDLARDAGAVAGRPGSAPPTAASATDRAYVIYTSGSTGKPKGTAVRHRNAVNFFTGMDERVGCGPADTVLAVTSVSFDISVLELLWPLTRGAKVVIAGERITGNLVPPVRATGRPLGFSLFFFAASAGTAAQDGYRLVVEAAKFADRHGFEAVWTPERHFHAFGGLYPNPSLMSAALATVTDRIALRCGSVVAPLHDTIRIAEEWSVVDNLSAGRVGLAFASGWNSNDFVLRPQNFPRRKELMAEQLEEFRRLWRGEPVRRTGGSGEDVEVRVFPAPVQDEPPVWLTSVGSAETFERAGASGVNILTHLLGQTPAGLAVKVEAYRKAREAAGHAGRGHVTVMVHTFMSEDTEDARTRARGPFADYLRSSTELWRTLFRSTGRDLPEMGAAEQIDAVVDLAVDRYFETSGLFGSPDTCAGPVRELAEAGVDEIACLVDFGLPPDDVLAGLTWVDRLRDAHEAEVADSRHSLAELCVRHGVTLLQGTPSLLSAVATEPEALDALKGLRVLLVGGEAFPSGLAGRLLAALPGVRVLNMYGPTETTIWSTTHELDPVRDATATSIPIGRPIANTLIRVLDPHGRPAPAGVPGELWIGGEAVAEGYVGRPEQTAERFVPAQDGTSGRYYRTGDRVRLLGDGGLQFLGRVDRQVKIRGHRIEPDEVESVLSRHEGVDSVAVTAVDGPHGTELVAYVAPRGPASFGTAQRDHVRHWGEVWDNAYTEGAAPEGAHGPDGALEGAEFVGWLSSHTGEPVPAAEMREWLGHTVARIRALRPEAVADIGVGVGLVLRSLAAEVTEYHGVDLAPAALDAAARCLGGPLPGHVRLAQAGPEYLAGLADDSLDTVVLNSVVQYFPGPDYLRQVIGEALRVVRPGGSVFLGDIRSLEMLTEFQTSVQLHRGGLLQTAAEIRHGVVRRLHEERELCLSPGFFRGFADGSDGVAEVRIELKRGRHDNELTVFRYDVTLVAGPAPEDGAQPPATPWSGTGGPDGLRRLLQREPGPLVVTGIPNRRLARPAAAVGAIASLADEETAWDLDRLLWEVDEGAAVHPEDLYAWADAAGRSLRALVPADGRLDAFDAVFGPAPAPATTPDEETEDAV
ncbi:amino acid adenylation domain-containing protein [Streptomyces sp. NPDC048603]|uniref:amino acid adenylation domain-containing protein n=1 Tax=Streptomyces sp. NPDC048603 TaxID=3365577 RepID=UPI0037158666